MQQTQQRQGIFPYRLRPAGDVAGGFFRLALRVVLSVAVFMWTLIGSIIQLVTGATARQMPAQNSQFAQAARLTPEQARADSLRATRLGTTAGGVVSKITNALMTAFNAAMLKWNQKAGPAAAGANAGWQYQQPTMAPAVPVPAQPVSSAAAVSYPAARCTRYRCACGERTEHTDGIRRTAAVGAAAER